MFHLILKLLLYDTDLKVKVILQVLLLTDCVLFFIVCFQMSQSGEVIQNAGRFGSIAFKCISTALGDCKK